MKYVLFVCTRTRGAPRWPKFEMQLHADWAITLACGAKCP